MLEDGTYVDDMLRKRMTEAGKTKPPLAGQFPKSKIEEVCVRADALAEINTLFYKRGWFRRAAHHSSDCGEGQGHAERFRP